MNPLMTDYPLKTDPKPVIVALDFAGEQDTQAFVRRLDPALCRLKVGKELFTATGRALVEKLVNQGFDVFLDLKYHDIPNTVAQACKVAAQMGVWLVDMHAGGGRRMMEAAANAVANFSRRPQLLGVTVGIAGAKLRHGRRGVFRPRGRPAAAEAGAGFSAGYARHPLGHRRQPRRPAADYDTRAGAGRRFELFGNGAAGYPGRRSRCRVARGQ